jgi:Superfamily I DNA and RNA helicases
VNYIADLHVHSHYSRATSKASNLYGLAAWAAVKGISVVGTGDFTHPGWFAHLHECLEPAEQGFFRLKTGGRSGELGDLLPPGIRPAMEMDDVRFVLSAEISSIYKRDGKVRKVHNLLYVPDLDSVRRLNATLATLGNITADGRPILGLDSRDLLEILLEKAPQGFLVPAHIWTPWFSLFGSKSGFDSVEECFGALSPHVFALETGLSSDPEMNRLISALDRFTLISNSDCHSPAKLGRETNIFATGFDYFSMREAIRTPVNAAGQQVFAATVEFYPEEGKYHCDGHRKCRVCQEPRTTRASGGLCPVCNKPLTIGVLHRVLELADREQPRMPPESPQVHSLIPLAEVVAELLGCGAASKKVAEGYVRLINAFGSEFGLLLETPVEEIRGRGFALLAEAIGRMRANRVIRSPGYDGEFGVITVFSEGERAELCGQVSLFGAAAGPARKAIRKRDRLESRPEKTDPVAMPTVKELNSEQRRAVDSTAALILVQAGPGAGKTNTLASRVRLLAARSDRPCTVIAFTNKAADEVRERLRDAGIDLTSVTVATFHGYCLAQLRRHYPDLRVAGPEDRAALIEELFSGWNAKKRETFSRGLDQLFRRSDPGEYDAETSRYLAALAEQSLVDIEAVVTRTVELLRQNAEEAAAIRAATGHLLVDEFQDINEAQYALVVLLAQTSTVFAIGDPNQAIYGFRGSDPQWFYAFIKKQHPELHSLTSNYRSAPVIITVAEQLIGRNAHALPLTTMQPRSSRQGTLHRQECATPEHEARFIAEQIEIRLGGTSHRSLERFDHTGTAAVGLSDIGILYRIGRQGEMIGKALAERGIPFQLVDLEAYYTKGECCLLYWWLLLLAGRAEAEHLLGLVRREQVIGEQALRLLHRVLRQTVRQQGRGLAGVPLTGGPIDAVLEPLKQTYEQIRALTVSEPAAAVLDALCARYRIDPNQPDVERLRELALTFGRSFSDFANHLARFSDSVLYDPRAEAVTLSTLHAAKGLEFPVVFIAGCEEGLLPLAQHTSSVQVTDLGHLEEERRLLYVGITRTIANLTITWCRSRVVYGGQAEPRQPSRFLDELPADAFSPVLRSQARQKKSLMRQLSLFS